MHETLVQSFKTSFGRPIMKRFYSILWALLLIGFVVPVNADVTSIAPSDDMYTDPDHSGSPVGELWVANYEPTGNYQRIMMKFDLNEFSGETINSATLNINRFFGCPSGDPTNVNLYMITQDWMETTWPSDQHIAHGDSIWASYVFSVNGWHEIDITSLVQAWTDGTIENFGLVIQALPYNKFTKCYSKEASSESVRPYLEIDHEASSIEPRHTVGQIRDYTLETYPNPFNSTTQIHLQIATGGHVKLAVYNLLGQEIAELHHGHIAAGSYSVKFNADNLPSGIYFVRLQAPAGIVTEKIVLMK
jgi:hypothetical protein